MKVGNCAAQEIGLGNEIGVEDGDELALRGLQAIFEGASLVAFAIGAMDVADRKPLGGVPFHTVARDFASFVGGIVEHLNVQQFARVIKLSDGIDQALDDVTLVEDGKLDGDARPAGNRRRRSGNILAVHEIFVEKYVTVQPVGGQDEEDDEVGNHHRQIERVCVVHAGKGFVGDLVPVLAYRAGLQGMQAVGEIEV